MKITILGSGTSTGVPEIGCTCAVCSSSDPKDNRLRTAALIAVEGIHLLIDCGPDFRKQMLRTSFFEKIDGLLLTHEHYDHVAGIDDLRPFCRFGMIDVYAESHTVDRLKIRIPYCFEENKYPGVPELALHSISLAPFEIKGVSIIPIRLMHNKLPIVGYRIGNMAYLTDLLSIPEEEYVKLEHLNVLIINALRIQEHISHQNLAQALKQIERIKPQKAYLIHINHHLGLHAEVSTKLPTNVYLGYDGLTIDS